MLPYNVSLLIDSLLDSTCSSNFLGQFAKFQFSFCLIKKVIPPFCSKNFLLNLQNWELCLFAQHLAVYFLILKCNFHFCDWSKAFINFLQSFDKQTAIDQFYPFFLNRGRITLFYTTNWKPERSNLPNQIESKVSSSFILVFTNVTGIAAREVLVGRMPFPFFCLGVSRWHALCMIVSTWK